MMHRGLWPGLLAGLLLCAATMAATADPAPDREPSITARLDRSRARLGEPLTLTVEIKSAGGAVAHLPDLGEELGPFTLLERGETRESHPDGDGGYRWTLRLAAYQPGELEVPPLTVVLVDPDGGRRELVSEPVPVTLELTQAAEGTPTLEDLVRPPQLETHRSLVRWWIFLGIVAGAGIVYLSIRALMERRRREARVASIDPREPEEVAAQRLRDLQEEGFLERGEHRPYFVRLGGILRGYLGRRYRFDALERTTRELRTELAARGAGAQLQAEVKELLELADRVKFARWRPSPGESGESMPRARKILELGRRDARRAVEEEPHATDEAPTEEAAS